MYKVVRVDVEHLEEVLNSVPSTRRLVGIYPEHIYDGTLFVVVFKVEED